MELGKIATHYIYRVLGVFNDYKIRRPLLKAESVPEGV